LITIAEVERILFFNQAHLNPTSQKVETLPPNSNVEEYRKHPQYAMAWEFEMWHWAKESKW
jgi:hypothetical protein